MSISPRLRDRTIAITAVVQAASLVQQVAETGQVNSADMKVMLESLLVENAPDTESVYGSVSQLRTGIEALNTQLSKKKDKKDVNLLRYVISLLHLERQLAKQPEMLALIDREIQQVPSQIDYFGEILSPQVIARFADIYQRTLSELKPRIQVYGDPGFLQQPDNINRVRALLLTGIRAAVLWQQKGGRRWQFLFQSGKLLSATEALSREI
ncbi:MAG: lysogenization regulator HflD [Methylophaga sp.]|uniref:High frequency lysogenization protein HflD homolog n=1 Tax=Methylophaga marina TaxID=45495 RepID=A0ABP3D3G0_9GAMM|nr:MULTISPECIES: high frequency lysogenization protein HflD [Methylophaga]MAX52266.1 lysogenization regulator HflD [Methylophaga sp.]BDZ75150.1 high frequency lysogenization protein HflD [Methylophaga marina]|tara:strand:- start:13176 stop:13808 length:633 start_codon:yes stop_codon:yes gene_type:complete